MKIKRIMLLLSMMIVSLMAFPQQYWEVKGYTESGAKSYFNSNISNLDLIEGIWQTSEGAKYSIEKDVENGSRQKDKYRVVVLEHFLRWWSTGDVQAFIFPGSSESLFSMKYYTKRESNGAAAGTRNYFLYQESNNIASFTKIINDYGDKEKVTWYKLYPKQNNNLLVSAKHSKKNK